MIRLAALALIGILGCGGEDSDTQTAPLREDALAITVRPTDPRCVDEMNACLRAGGSTDECVEVLFQCARE